MVRDTFHKTTLLKAPSNWSTSRDSQLLWATSFSVFLHLSYKPPLNMERPQQNLPGGFSSPGWRAPSLSICLHSRGAPALWSFLGPSVQEVHILLMLGVQSWCSAPGAPGEQSRGDKHFTSLTLLIALLLRLQTHTATSYPLIFPSPSPHSCTQPIHPSLLHWYWGLSQPTCRTRLC